MIPLIKPYKIIKQQGQQEWLLNSSASKNEISDLPIIESITDKHMEFRLKI